ncbi:MAG: hypothetical protein ACYC61_10335 [Isosphaeraceae bacterium]
MNDPSEIGTTIATYVYEVRLQPPVRFEHSSVGRGGSSGGRAGPDWVAA